MDIVLVVNEVCEIFLKISSFVVCSIEVWKIFVFIFSLIVCIIYSVDVLCGLMFFKNNVLREIGNNIWVV